MVERHSHVDNRETICAPFKQPLERIFQVVNSQKNRFYFSSSFLFLWEWKLMSLHIPLSSKVPSLASRIVDLPTRLLKLLYSAKGLSYRRWILIWKFTSMYPLDTSVKAFHPTSFVLWICGFVHYYAFSHSVLMYVNAYLAEENHWSLLPYEVLWLQFAP